jgi:putative salt-induced outer membrane protein
MKLISKLATASVIALLAATPVMAQDRLVGTKALDDRIDDITDDVNEDLTRGDDDERFGPTGVAQGFRGSIALTASGASGNTDTGELSGAGRLSYGIGDWNHSAGFAIEYGEANNQKNEEKFFATYEAQRYFNEKFYLFGIGRYEYDGFSAPTVPGGAPVAGNSSDAFLGFGPGYRVINTPDQAWRIQAGVGVRHTKDFANVSETEEAIIASSRYFMKLTDTMSLTNDTDILSSSANTVVSNDLGVNFKVSNNLSTRVSYRTDYNSDPAIGRKSTDNTMGLSLVLGF